MTRLLSSLVIAVFLFAFGIPAGAADLRFDGPFTQGGLVIGHAPPGSTVTVDGRTVRVSAKGEFLLGFGRDAAPNVTVRVDEPSGAAETRTFTVARRDFPTQRINGLPPKEVTPDPAVLKRIRAEAELIVKAREKDSATPFFDSGFIWPVHGPLSGVFGSQRILNGKPRAPHSGVDIAAPRGTPVLAAADGIVTLANQGMFFTGKTLMIDHGFGLSSVYAHMETLLVHVGQRVRKGTPIGKVGATGRATGPHLHWGVSLFGTRLDPALLVPPQNAG